jgi:hypothetical protein
MNAVIMVLVRHGLTTLGGGLMASGAVSPTDWDAVVGAVVTLVGLAMSIAEKKAAGRLRA